MGRRNNRNFGIRPQLDRYTIQKLATQTAQTINRGDATQKKIVTALTDFGKHLREEFGIRDIERTTVDHLRSWAGDLRERMAAGEIGKATPASYISAINSVFKAFAREETCLSAKDVGLARGTRFSNVNLANSPETHQAFRNFLDKEYIQTNDIRYQGLKLSVDIQRESAGMRFRESAAIKIAGKDLSQGILHLDKNDMTKNGQPRDVKILSTAALVKAKEFVGGNKEIYSRGSLIPGKMTYQQYHDFAYNVVQKFNQSSGEKYNYHGNRHEYAHALYAKTWAEKTGVEVQAPVEAGMFKDEHIAYIAQKTGMEQAEAKEMDQEIREEVSESLGHHRLEASYDYLGH